MATFRNEYAAGRARLARLLPPPRKKKPPHTRDYSSCARKLKTLYKLYTSAAHRRIALCKTHSNGRHIPIITVYKRTCTRQRIVL
jgi:hypothetical protein